MRKVVLYIAMSLDGYLADSEGGVDWLRGQTGGTEQDGSYPEFIQTVDTVIMGYTTYHQIVTELSPDVWYYSGKKSYVLTHRELEDQEEIAFVNRDAKELIRELKRQEGRNIWICGGAEVVRQLVDSDLIDEYTVSIIPTILGKGIRLFSERESERKLLLKSTRSYDGIVDLVYGRRE